MKQVALRRYTKLFAIASHSEVISKINKKCPSCHSRKCRDSGWEYGWHRGLADYTAIRHLSSLKIIRCISFEILKEI